MPETKANTNNKTRSPLKIYLLLMTLTGVIGSLISIGILVFSVAKQVVITDHEYIMADRYYELEQCEQGMNKNNVEYKVPSGYYGVEDKYVEPTESEIEECKAEKTERLIASRKASFKIDMLNGGIWTILFLILMFAHYPRFKRLHKD